MYSNIDTSDDCIEEEEEEKADAKVAQTSEFHFSHKELVEKVLDSESETQEQEAK